MREVEIGDTITSQGTVVKLDKGTCQITTLNGDLRWVEEKYYQLVEPPPFNVGDQVKTKGNSTIGTIDKITQQNPLHRVIADDGSMVGMFDANWIKPVPPEPECVYRMRVEDDHLILDAYEKQADATFLHSRKVRAFSLSDQRILHIAIAGWAREFGIDADEACKLAAKPRVIGKRVLGPSHYATAICDGSGWFVTLTARYVLDLDSTYLPGDPQDESTGKGIFPGINGLYEVSP